MSDSGKSGGLLSKVMHMVRGGTISPQGAVPEFEGAIGGQEVLQAALVRRRRNDAIRHQEFAQLRQLRQRNAADAQAHIEPEQMAGVLSSLMGQETRSSETLQKIDAIEAQMSGQWWRQPDAGKVAGAAARGVSPRWSQLPVLGEESVVPDAAPAQESSTSQPQAPVQLPLPEPATPSAQPVAHAFVSDPILEEAAILFAHGDLEGARTRLLEQLVQALSLAPSDDVQAAMLWPMLLDWCRATGDEDSFEPLALDYAEHFGRSAPLWFSIPERLGMSVLAGKTQQRQSQRQWQWSSPAVLTPGAVTALSAAQQEAPPPWQLSWLRLQAVDEAAAAPLLEVVQRWSSQKGQFALSDAAALLQVLGAKTPVGGQQVRPVWWLLHMAVLRWMGDMDAYEAVALDYCMTYEVSPPAWVPPVCHSVVQAQGSADMSTLQTSLQHSHHMGAVQGGAALAAQPDAGVLVGVMEGDVQAWLDALSAYAAQVAPARVEISCANLIRVDFVAAGSLLNWAADIQRQGMQLQLTQVNQLVAVFFHTLGLQAHAQIKVATF